MKLTLAVEVAGCLMLMSSLRSRVLLRSLTTLTNTWPGKKIATR